MPTKPCEEMSREDLLARQSKNKIGDDLAPYPRRMRQELAEAVDGAAKILRIRGAYEMAWTLEDAFRRRKKE